MPDGEGLSNARTPVAALGAVMLVAETRHQLIPGIRNSLDAPAGPSGLGAETESWQRRADHVEGVEGLPAVPDRVGQWPDDLSEFNDGARPAVRHDQRERVGLRRPHVQEVNTETVDAGAELREAV